MRKKTTKCPVCEGKGFVNRGWLGSRLTCGHCDGYGYVNALEAYDLRKKVKARDQRERNEG